MAARRGNVNKEMNYQDPSPFQRGGDSEAAKSLAGPGGLAG